jgi:hypothetical protein
MNVARATGGVLAAALLCGLAACGPDAVAPDSVAVGAVGAVVARSTGEPVVRPVVAARAAPKPASATVSRPAPAKVAPRAVKKTRVTSTATSSATASRVSAATLHATGCDGTSGWVARRGAYALKRLSYDYKPLGYTIAFLPGRRGITGMTYPAQKRIEVYIRSCSKMTVAYLAETIAHEIGHAVDFTRGTDAWRRQWQVARHISLSIPWYGRPYATDFATPAGDFAESFAAWQVPDGPNDSEWGRPSKAQLALLVPLMTI